jgi:NADPH-dependent glutamate synthase beta subunit-like oxidoreductase
VRSGNDVDHRHHEVGAPARTPDVVPVSVSVSNDFPGGAAGFFARWRSLLTGLGITGRRALGPTTTLRYPHEKVTLSPRWRGALHLRGVLGLDAIPLIEDAPPAYNAPSTLYRADRLPPCVGNCPANVDARGQGYFLGEGKPAEAYELVRERNILPGVLGRICHHPCETACRRNYYDEPIAIRPLHRHAYEEYAKVAHERLTPFERTRDQRIAIIGSGPSGLTAAYDLMKLGYSVSVYEKEKKPGGALYSGVPSYRLPREVLHDEIDNLVALGMELKLGVEVGKDVPIDYLLGEYDAVLIAVGLQESRIIPVPGHTADGVLGALPFLRDANWKGDAGVSGKRVLVIGGGNVAVDVARCALRTGAAEVRLACLEGDGEMPCHPWEIEEALDEGVIAMCSLGPEEVLVDDAGKVRGMRMRECISVFDAMVASPRSSVTSTPSARGCRGLLRRPGTGARRRGRRLGPTLTERGLLPVDGTLFTTHHPGVFACGEVVTGPGQRDRIDRDRSRGGHVHPSLSGGHGPLRGPGREAGPRLRQVPAGRRRKAWRPTAGESGCRWPSPRTARRTSGRWSSASPTWRRSMRRPAA